MDGFAIQRHRRLDFCGIAVSITITNDNNNENNDTTVTPIPTPPPTRSTTTTVRSTATKTSTARSTTTLRTGGIAEVNGGGGTRLFSPLAHKPRSCLPYQLGSFHVEGRVYPEPVATPIPPPPTTTNSNTVDA